MTKSYRFRLLPAGVLVAVALIGAFAGFGSMSGAPGLVKPSPSQDFDARVLLREFQDAQQAELNRVLAKEKAAERDLKNAQASKQKDFDQTEKIARRKFFADQHPGAEKRTYMRDLLQRRDVFRKALADERSKAKDESDERVRALKDTQNGNLLKFKDALSRGERPADTLWPQPGT